MQEWDLHSNNNYLGIMAQKDKRVHKKKLPNELPMLLEELAPYRDEFERVVVDSTFNRYWLVDGLMDNGFLGHIIMQGIYKDMSSGASRPKQVSLPREIRFLYVLILMGDQCGMVILQPKQRNNGCLKLGLVLSPRRVAEATEAEKRCHG